MQCSLCRAVHFMFCSAVHCTLYTEYIMGSALQCKLPAPPSRSPNFLIHPAASRFKFFISNKIYQNFTFGKVIETRLCLTKVLWLATSSLWHQDFYRCFTHKKQPLSNDNRIHYLLIWLFQWWCNDDIIILLVIVETPQKWLLQIIEL